MVLFSVIHSEDKCCQPENISLLSFGHWVKTLNQKNQFVQLCPALGFVAIFLGRHLTGNYNLESGTIICKKTMLCKRKQ